MEAFHTLETPLQPGCIYQWTVRARYTSGGIKRVTEWAKWYGEPGPVLDVMALGLTYLLPDPIRRYYLFRTTESTFNDFSNEDNLENIR